MKVLVVGAGLYGATMARMLADYGHRVTVIERRKYIGGQMHTTYNEVVDCHIHEHGPHIFRTNNADVLTFVRQFAEFNRFVNRPKVIYRDEVYSFPINLMTLYQVFGCKTPQAARQAVLADC